MYISYKPAGQSLLTSPWTPCERLLARLLAGDFSRETPRERLLGAGRENATTNQYSLNNQMITHGSMSFGAANECDARDKNKIAMIGTRRRSRRSRRGQDCEARDEDMITTLATRKISRRSRRGQDCDARNEDKIATLATMTDRYDVLQQTQKK